MRRLAVLLACATLLAGCGSERQPPAKPTAVVPPAGWKRVTIERAGISLRVPRNWELRQREAPQVFTLSSGAGFVTAFAYPRAEPLPDTAAELAAAKERLVRQVRRRDREFALAEARTTEVAGAPAIVLRGRQTLSGRRLDTRSVHIFSGRVEYVIEAIAPPEGFAVADRQVLRPLLRSLRLSGRVRRSPG